MGTFGILTWGWVQLQHVCYGRQSQPPNDARGGEATHADEAQGQERIGVILKIHWERVNKANTVEADTTETSF